MNLVMGLDDRRHSSNCQKDKISWTRSGVGVDKGGGGWCLLLAAGQEEGKSRGPFV